MAKVCIVLYTGGSILNPILGVYSVECEAQAKELAETWMNESAGENVYSGRSIGRNRDIGFMAWTVIREISETPKT